MTVPVVYIVDDDDDVRGALAFLLRTARYSVETFSSAKAFLEREGVTSPSCLLTDIRMAEMDGLGLQKIVATRFRGLPVILMSGHGNEPLAIRAIQDGVVDFLEKPFTDDQLISCIQRAVGLGFSE